MARTKTKTPPLSPEQVASFREVIQTIVNLEHEFEQREDFDGSTALINQLYYCGVTPEDFDTFQQIIDTANDSEMRSPK